MVYKKMQSGPLSSSFDDGSFKLFLPSLKEWHTRLGHPSFPIVKATLYQQGIARKSRDRANDNILFGKSSSITFSLFLYYSRYSIFFCCICIYGQILKVLE